MDANSIGAAAVPSGQPTGDPAPPYHDFQIGHAKIRAFDRSDDASDIYVIEVFGVSVLIRQRRQRRPRGGGDPELYVHIDNEDGAPTDLALEVVNRGETPVAATTPPKQPPAAPLYMPAADWEDVLDGLGAAAERTSADIDCVACAADAACAAHDDDWARVDRWRALATRLRHQLAAAPADVRAAVLTPTSAGAVERAFAALNAQQRSQLLRGVFEILEYDEDGQPGTEWSPDTTQALSKLFIRFGIEFTSTD